MMMMIMMMMVMMRLLKKQLAYLFTPTEVNTEAVESQNAGYRHIS